MIPNLFDNIGVKFVLSGLIVVSTYVAFRGLLRVTVVVT
jgi:hypothetical protein